MNLLRPTFLEINSTQLRQNFSTFQKWLGRQAFLCPMIKANAYGHGDQIVAKALSQAGCRWLGVASVEEGLHLRDSHLPAQVLVFGFIGEQAARTMIEHQLTPVVSDLEQLKVLIGLSDQTLRIHLKLNTGMNRLGFRMEDISEMSRLLQNSPHLHVEGVATHLHTGEDLNEPESSAQQQIEIFQNMIGRLMLPSGVHLHVYNSAAASCVVESQGPFQFGVRPGLLTYGVAPEGQELPAGLEQVLSFKSRVVSIQHLQADEVVSYGGTWRAPRKSTIAIVPAGYADGISRSLSDRGFVLVKGSRCPIRGRVCMDYTMIDVTELEPTNLVGEEVIFLGGQGQDFISVKDVACWAERSPYEILTSIGERVPRLVVEA